MKKRLISMMMLVALALAGCSASNSTQTQVIKVNSESGDTEIDADDLETEATTSVQNGVQVSEQYVFAMDKEMYLTVYGDESDSAIAAAADEINRIDSLLSVGDKDSEIYKINNTGSAVISDETYSLIERAIEIGKDTKGALDITVYPLMDAWGFTTQNYRVPDESEIKSLLETMGTDKISYDKSTSTLTVADGTQIDLGAIAKGYTSSRLMEIFSQYDVDSAMVSLGGNVHVYGTKTDGSDWNVAIADPDDTSSYLGAVKIADKCVITSGGYERYFEQDGVTYHHILDPSTGYPADSGLTSVTIVSDDGTLADGLSTALFVMGLEDASDYWRQHSDEFDFVIKTSDGKVYITSGIENVFSSSYKYEVVSK